MVGATSGASSAVTTTMVFRNHKDTPFTSIEDMRNQSSTMYTTHTAQPQYPLRIASPLSETSDEICPSQQEHDKTNSQSDSSWDSSDYSSDSDDDYDDNEHNDVDSRRTRPLGPHLVVDTDTMRLPSGRIISSRGTGTGGGVGLSHPRRRQQQNRRAPPGLLHEEEKGDGVRPSPKAHYPSRTSTSPQSDRQPAPPHLPTLSAPTELAAPATIPDTPSPPTALSRRETKRRALTTQLHARLRPSDQQTLSRLSQPEQRALLATTQRAAEHAQREETRFAGKMDSLGNIQVSERFVNDVPGGRAHRNRFFAR